MQSPSFSLSTAATVVALVASFGTSIAAPTYSFTTVGVPGALETFGGGINNAGQVAGYSQSPYNPASTSSGYVFNPSSGTYTTVVPPAAQSDSFARGINNLGQVVGSYITSFSCNPTNCQSAFLFNTSNGSYTTLNNPVAGVTIANGINDAGQIVGYSTYIPSGPGVAVNDVPFLRDPVTGVYTSFAAPAQGAVNVFFQGINNAGLIVGYYTTPTGFALGSSFGGTDHSFIFDPATGKYTFLDDPLALQGTTVGFMGTTGGTDAFGINDLGQVVGTYYAPGGLQSFIYNSASGTYTTLTNPAIPDQHLSATGINNSGQIVGTFFTGNSAYSTRAFIATPEQVFASVPEPSSLALLGVSASCLWLTRRRAEGRA